MENNHEIYPYKRIDHLKNILKQFWEKKIVYIPQSVIDDITNEILKRQINGDLNLCRLRLILKKLHYGEYLEYILNIFNIVTGTEPLILSKKNEIRIIQMFELISKIYNICCPPNRLSFFNYDYVLHRILQQLELIDYLIYFPLYKNKVKLRHNDKIWKKICDYYGWKTII